MINFLSFLLNFDGFALAHVDLLVSTVLIPFMTGKIGWEVLGILH